MYNDEQLTVTQTVKIQSNVLNEAMQSLTLTFLLSVPSRSWQCHLLKEQKHIFIIQVHFVHEGI